MFADKLYVQTLNDIEKADRDRVSSCHTSQVELRYFENARRNGERAASLIRMGRERCAERHALAALRDSRGLHDLGP